MEDYITHAQVQILKLDGSVRTVISLDSEAQAQDRFDFITRQMKTSEFDDSIWPRIRLMVNHKTEGWLCRRELSIIKSPKDLKLKP